MTTKFGYHFKSIEYNKVVYYDKAKLDLDYSGITVIQGWNKNAKGKKRVTNATGKSLLLAGIPNVLKNSAPALSSGKRSSGAKGSMVTEQGSFIKLALERQNIDYRVKKYKKGSVKYQIDRNGKDLELATATKAEHYIGEKIFPVSETAFYTYFYLYGKKQFPLQVGTSTERMDFFSNLFDLHKFDQIRDAFVAQRKALNDDQVRLKEIRKQYAELEIQIKDIDIDQLELSKNTLVNKIKKYEDELVQLEKKKKNWMLYELNKDQWAKLDKSIPISDLLNKLNKKKSITVLWEKEWNRYQKYLNLKEAWIPGMEKAKKKIGAIHKATAEHKIKTLRKERKLLEKELHQLVKPTEPDKVDRVKVAYEKYGQGSLSKLLQHCREESARFMGLCKIQEQLNKLGQSNKKCFVCGSKVANRLTDHLAEYKKEQQKWESLTSKVEQAILYKRYKKEYKTYQEGLEEYRAAKTNIKNSLAELEDESKYVLALEGHTWLEQNPMPVFAPLNLKVPHVLDGAREVPKEFDSESRSKLDRKIDRITNLLKIESVLKSVECSIDEHKDATSRYKKIKGKLQECIAEEAKIEPHIVNYKRVQKQIKRLKTDIEELTANLSDLPIIEKLIELYGKNGRKLDVMRRFAKALDENMNDKAPLVFPEPMHFEFTVGPNTMDLMVTRGTGKKAKTSDVKLLSGAETQQFNICFVSALVPMLPMNKRSNMIVLDEVDSGMNEAAAELFRNEFLPELQKIIPHVIIVTPLNEQYPNARIFTAVKEGNVSTLVKGAL